MDYERERGMGKGKGESIMTYIEVRSASSEEEILLEGRVRERESFDI